MTGGNLPCHRKCCVCVCNKMNDLTDPHKIKLIRTKPKKQTKKKKKREKTNKSKHSQKKCSRLVPLCLLLKRLLTGGGGESKDCLLFASTPLLHSDSSLLAVLTSACQNARLVGVDFFLFLFPFFFFDLIYGMVVFD